MEEKAYRKAYIKSIFDGLAKLANAVRAARPPEDGKIDLSGVSDIHVPRHFPEKGEVDFSAVPDMPVPSPYENKQDQPPA